MRFDAEGEYRFSQLRAGETALFGFAQYFAHLRQNADGFGRQLGLKIFECPVVSTWLGS